jgi:hypothetical protein
MDRKIAIAFLWASIIFPQPAFAASSAFGCDISAIPMAILLVGVCFALELKGK